MKYSSVAIIIPAYNESENLRLLIAKIFVHVPACKVIVVDDSTGIEKTVTKQIIEKINDTHVSLFQRDGKGGRGSAVIYGMAKALDDKKILIVVEMDADLGHDPKELSLLLAKIPPADMVIGSRYMQGSMLVDWPKSRLIQSKIINFFLRFWLGLNITDYTDGYRAYTRQACKYLTSIPLYEKGFISLSEVAFKLHRKGFTIAEAPITFTDRKFGKSKTNVQELISSLIGVLRVRMRG